MSYNFLKKLNDIIDIDSFLNYFNKNKIICIVIKTSDIVIDEITTKIDILSDSEKKACKSKRFDLDKKNSFISSFIKRYIISKVANIKPQDIEFKYSNNGKPLSKYCFFNVSHSKEYTIIAIYKNNNVGVDIQNSTPYLSEKYFNESEKDYIAKHSNYNYTIAQIWAMKESIIKCNGYGITEEKIPKFNINNENNQISNNEKIFHTHDNVKYIINYINHKDEYAICIAYEELNYPIDNIIKYYYI